MDNIDTEGLIGIQVAQLEKEKKEMNERLRVISKRIDHVERSFRKQERPLLAQDYENQQKTDKETFEAIQRARQEAARQSHREDLATKERLARVMDDFIAWREVLLKKKGEEHAKKLEIAKRKISEEKEKRRKAVMKQREEERERREKEEQARREREAEEARIEAELRAEEDRLREEEEARQREAEEEKRKAEREAAARKEQREKERAETAERVRLQQKREEEAEARSKARRLESVRKPPAAEEPQAWRRVTTTVRDGPPSRSESPAPVAASATLKYRPGAAGGGSGGWRAREEAKAVGSASNGTVGKAGAGTPRSGSPVPHGRKEDAKKEDDGFQTVSSRGVWKPKRGRP